jgi:hypothetical protein
MGVRGQRHAPASLYPPEKGPPVPIIQEAGWAPETVWTQAPEEKSSAPVRDRTPIVQPVVRHYTTWATAALYILYIFFHTNAWREYCSEKLTFYYRRQIVRRKADHSTHMFSLLPWSQSNGFPWLPDVLLTQRYFGCWRSIYDPWLPPQERSCGHRLYQH